MKVDSEQLYWDRPLLSIIRFPLYYFFAMPVLALFNWAVFGLRIQDRRQLKNLHKMVVVCNHTHYLDCTMMALAAFPRQLVFFSQKSNFKLPVAGSILRLTGANAIGSTFSEIRKFESVAVNKARKGVWLAIFPEGNLSIFNPNLQPFKKGAFHIACQAGVPVLPMIIVQRSTSDLWHRLTHLPALTLKVLPPLHPDPELDKFAAAEHLRDQTFAVMADGMGKA